MAKLAVIKTKPTELSVAAFIDGIADEQKRKDSHTILKLMEKAMKEKPKMWGSSMIGFGDVRYKSPATGREIDWFRIGFSPRKTSLSLYITGDINRQHVEALRKLGKHKMGKGCLYINKLDDVDLNILREMITLSLTAEYFPQ